jgi:HlyD family secretion protein
MKFIAAVLMLGLVSGTAFQFGAFGSPRDWREYANTQSARWLPTWRSDSKPDEQKYVVAPVDRGNIVSSVSASGALTAVATILVASQVSGQISRIIADYNTEVQKGDVIAEIDPTSFQISVEQAQAELLVAEASVLIQERLRIKATAEFNSAKSVIQTARYAAEQERIAVAEARRDVERKRTLAIGGNVSQVDLVKVQAAVERAIQSLMAAEANSEAKAALAQAAEAHLYSVEAQILHAKAVVLQKESTLKAAKTELERTKIRSPTNGVIIGRTIEEGQQVTVTLQAQTLFTVAQDLTEMQIKISVDEADIGRILEGQQVIYTVDSYPGREFRGEVKQIRKDAQPVQNVVTYVVVASAPNPGKILIPGMTANARIIIDSRRDVVKVPVAALRFMPSKEASTKESHVWVLGNDRRPKAVPVKVGLSDGKMVEVASETPLEQVITGIDASAPPPTLARRVIGSI